MLAKEVSFCGRILVSFRIWRYKCGDVEIYYGGGYIEFKIGKLILSLENEYLDFYSRLYFFFRVV